MLDKSDCWNMDTALKQAEKAFYEDEVPVGAIIIDEFGSVISEAHNLKEKSHDPTSHAEILAIREACEKKKNWRLEGCTMYVTLEPCPMCLSALLQARIDKLVFGAYDPKGGALSLGYHFNNDSRLNHTFKVMGGIRHFEASQLLSNFFRGKRDRYKTLKFHKS